MNDIKELFYRKNTASILIFLQIFLSGFLFLILSIVYYLEKNSENIPVIMQLLWYVFGGAFVHGLLHLSGYKQVIKETPSKVDKKLNLFFNIK